MIHQQQPLPNLKTLCDSGQLLSRRDLLGRCGIGLGMLGLADVLHDSGELVSAASIDSGFDPLLVRARILPRKPSASFISF